MKLNDARVILTGGAGGVGMATARRLLEAGCIVTLWDLSPEALTRAVDDLVAEGCRRDRVYFHRVDVTDRQTVAEAVGAALADMGGVDVLINNAGHLAPGNLLDQGADVWETIVRVNLAGVINVTHEVLPHLFAQEGGHIVNICSAASFVGVPGLAVYSATKWAVWGLTEALRHEAKNAGHPGVRYSSVHPNYISRGLFEGARIGGLGGLILPRLRDHDVVAKAVVESALKRGRRVVRRPRSLILATLLRGLLPDAAYSWATRALDVHTSMRSWTGRREEEQ
jgi:all-trans-retinol dehydrogenase (NAD+)